MKFDPAVAAQASFRQAQEACELGDDLDMTLKAEETFSSSVGETATAAYQKLQQIGERHPEAISFQEFLIYITWHQVMEETIPAHFKKGIELCDRYLRQVKNSGDRAQVRQIRELRASFLAGLGLGGDEEDDYREDEFKGGD